MGISTPCRRASSRADRQVVIPLRLPAGVTIATAIRESGIQQMFPEIDLARNTVGVFGELTELSRILAQGDRVEIYRPLPKAPPELRRRRAADA